MLNLRPYQQAFRAAIQDAWRSVRTVLGVLPTGGGKTVVFSSIMHDHTGAAAAIVHRKEIVGQISLALGALEVKHRIIAPPQVVTRIRRQHLKKLGRSFIDPHAQAGVVSVQTLTSRSSGKNELLQRWVRQVTLAVFDEGHHYVRSGLWGRAVELLGSARQLFVTATPERADGKGLGAQADGYAEAMVEGPSMHELIRDGYLCPFEYKAPASDLDVSDVPLTATGDLNTREMRKRVVQSHLVGDVVSQYQQYLPGKRAIVFATDVESANDIAQAFRDAGIAAEALSGDTDQGERDRVLDEFEAGRLQVLVNVDLFDEGFDVPACDGAILARPTESLAKYLQMVGRALRCLYAAGFDLDTVDGRRAAVAASAKPRAIIIDPVRNWERHGLPNWPRRWTLDGKAPGERRQRDGLQMLVACQACTQPYERFHRQCPYCGHVPQPGGRQRPEQVCGDLLDLDVDALSALFERIQRADCDDQAYIADQIARQIPPVGRPADLRRHQTAKYRRSVLRELMAWWWGSQPPERTDSEKYRRFYLRFGIDTATALTLNAKDTDALIERVGALFGEDMQ